MKDPVTLRPATPADLPAVAAFIARMSARPEQHCLHSGTSVEGITRDLATLWRPLEESVVLAILGDRIVGLVAADFAEDQERGWLWGPFAEGVDPVPLGEQLVERLLGMAPPGVAMVDFFLDPGNVFIAPLAERHGFGEPRTVHVYRAERPAEGFPTAQAPGIATADDLAPLAALHEASFPNTWRTAAELLAADVPTWATFVHRIEGRFLGYIHVEADPAAESAHVHYLAVDSGARGRGIGRRLLDQGLDWCFNARGATAVSLTVFDGLANARALYESAGFRLETSGVTRRWRRG